MARTEIKNKWISKIKLSWTGSPTTADGVVHRNYEVVLRKVKFLTKDKTLQKQADRRWNKSFVEAIRLCGIWLVPGVLTNQHSIGTWNGIKNVCNLSVQQMCSWIVWECNFHLFVKLTSELEVEPLQTIRNPSKKQFIVVTLNVWSLNVLFITDLIFFECNKAWQPLSKELPVYLSGK